jgi:uncharacterized damage-inducible protein DinB
MEDEVKGYLTEFGILRGQINDALKGLTDEGANWCPPPENTNSVYSMINHLTGAQAHWIKRIIGGMTIQRDRDTELNASGSLVELVKKWEAVNKEADEIMGKLTPGQLRETRDTPGPMGKITVQWAILHALSHYAIHLGHIQLTRQIWEYHHQKPG